MGEQPCRDRLSRRSLLAASGALAAGTLLPGVALAERPGTGTEPSGEQTRTVTGTLRPDVSDWYYLPVDLPAGVREIEVGYSYGRRRCHRVAGATHWRLPSNYRRSCIRPEPPRPPRTRPRYRSTPSATGGLR